MGRISEKAKDTAIATPGRVAKVVKPNIIKILSPWTSRFLSLTSIFISLLASVCSGYILSRMLTGITNFEALLIVIPPFVALRGNVFGSLVSRLSTEVHLGTYEVNFNIKKSNGANFISSLWLSFSITVVLAFIAQFVSLANSNCTAIPLGKLIMLLFLASLIPTFLVFLLTIFVAQNSIKYGWDIDSIGAPIITASADLLSVPSLLGAFLIVNKLGMRTNNLSAAFVVLALSAVGVYFFMIGKKNYKRIVIESFPTFVAVSLFSFFAGKLLQGNIETIQEFPFLLILASPMFSLTGAISSLFAAKVSTNLHLGVNQKTYGNTLKDWATSFVLSLPTLTLLGFGVFFVGDANNLFNLIMLAFFAGITGVFVSNLCAGITSSLVFKLGLDPDTFAVPLVTSVSDWLGALSLFFWAAIIY